MPHLPNTENMQRHSSSGTLHSTTNAAMQGSPTGETELKPCNCSGPGCPPVPSCMGLCVLVQPVSKGQCAVHVFAGESTGHSGKYES